MERASRRVTQPDALFGCVHEGPRRRDATSGSSRAIDCRLPDWTCWIVASAGDLLTQPLPGAGDPNPLCRDFVRKDDDPSENARSVGMLIGYGRFRMLDLGDLTWNKEHGLACPTNMIGKVDLYLTTHHGTPVVRTGGSRSRRRAARGGDEQRIDEGRLARSVEDRANVTRPRGFLAIALRSGRRAGPQRRRSSSSLTRMRRPPTPIRLTAYQDGRFSLTNARNGHSVEVQSALVR